MPTGKRQAILADIHSNIEALTEVLKDIRREGVDETICLGDLIGYGPNPAEVVDEALEWNLVVMGNHEEAALKGGYGFNPMARAAIDWTRDQLRPAIFSGRAKRDRWTFLSGLPPRHEEGGALFLHGSPRDPTTEYILRSDCRDLLGGMSEKLRDIFSRFEGLCFVGHTHDPGVITEEGEFIPPSASGGSLVLEAGRKYIVNPGSVGQPRDGDTRASYILYEPADRRVTFRRVSYDYRATMKKILDIPTLDRRCAERLALGR